MDSNLIKIWTERVKLHGLNEVQRMLLHDKHRFIINSAGRRARKTLIGINKMVSVALDKENIAKTYYLLAPTILQARKVFWQKLKDRLRFVDTDISETERIITIRDNSNRIIVDGTESADRIEGEEKHGLYLTEFPNMKQRIWFENILPMVLDTGAFCWIDGTPDYRYPHYRDLAEQAIGSGVVKAEPFKPVRIENPYDKNWVFYTWQSVDVVGEEALNELKSFYDPLIFRQEFEGEFIQSGGAVWHAYSTDNLSEQTYNPTLNTVLCYDFNVNPMTVLVNQEIEVDKWCYVKEFVLNDSHTLAASRVAEDYLKDLTGTLQVTGDYTGIARDTTSSGLSDWAIIDEIFRNFKGFQRKIRNVSKNKKDAINSLNAMFKNANGEIKQYVNKHQCPYLHKDLTRQVHREDGTLNDENGTIGHRSDAAMYFSYNYYPIKKDYTSARIQ